MRLVCMQVGVAARRESLGETLAGLQEMLMYGLKGMAAYTHHAGSCWVEIALRFSFAVCVRAVCCACRKGCACGRALLDSGYACIICYLHASGLPLPCITVLHGLIRHNSGRYHNSRCVLLLLLLLICHHNAAVATTHRGPGCHL